MSALKPSSSNTGRSSAVHVTRLTDRLQSDSRRVISRYLNLGSDQRIQSIVARVMSLPEDEVSVLLRQVFDEFAHRHHRLETIFERHFDRIQPAIDPNLNI